MQADQIMPNDNAPERNNHHRHLFNILAERGCFYSGITAIGGKLWHSFYFKCPKLADSGGRLIARNPWITETTVGTVWRVSVPCN